VAETVATHKPVPDANFLVRADLEPHGMAGKSEQLWVKQMD
jgi:hypothetical protein